MSSILNVQKISFNTLKRTLSTSIINRVVNDGHTPSAHEKFHRPHKILDHSQDIVKPSISFPQKLVLKTLKGIFNVCDTVTYLPNKFMGKYEYYENLKNMARSLNTNPTNSAGPWRDPSTVDGELVKSAFEGVSTVPDLWNYSVKQFGNLDFIGEREVRRVFIHKNNEGIETQLIDFGDYKWKTYGKVNEDIQNIRKGLQNLNIKKGDRILFFAETRPEWITCALACLNSGIEIVTAYPTLGSSALHYILDDVNIKHIITSESSYNTLNQLLTSNTTIENLIVFKDRFRQSKLKKHRPAPIDDRKTIPENIIRNTDKITPYDKLLSLAKKETNLLDFPIKSDDLGIILYTSGSTGEPKAAEITHEYIIANISGWKLKWTDVDKHSTYMAYLPLSHIMELLAEMYCIGEGNKLAFSSPLTLVTNGPKLRPGVYGDMSVIQPKFFATVPMVINRLKKTVNEHLANTSYFTQNLFSICYDRKVKRIAKGLSTPILDKVIFKNTSSIFGGNLELMVVGSAPLDKDLGRFVKVTMNALVLQGYGLTECVAATVDYYSDIYASNCGGVTASCELLLRECPEYSYSPKNSPPQGEILLSGPGVIKRYFKDRNSDSFVEIDGKRWFCTGDIGEIHENGSIKVIDRIKGLKKLSNGEFVSLAAVEGQLLTSQYVDQVCVVVDSKLDYCLAIIVANEKNVVDLGSKLELKLNFEELCKHKGIRTFILYHFEELLKEKLVKYEIPKKIILVKEPFTVQNGLLTDAMKLKRNVIESKYKDVIEIIYRPFDGSA
uniref:long-chain-fatty-acid--CoA ligase n=1 Tax=Strongyloides venezuelensis TaxID=75913 RepID=A0A0K0G452_STRVS